MRQFSLTLIMAFIASTFCSAQEVDYNKIILPANLENVEIQERLVQLAWKNYPENKMYREQITVAREDLKQDRRQWLTNFAISGNANEFVLNESADELNRANFFPKYNLSARLSLGLLFVNPSVKRENEARIRIAEHDLNRQKLLIRKEVFDAYQNLLKFLELYKIQLDITDDSYSNYLLAEQQFENGKLTLEEFNVSLQQYNTQKKERIIAENNYLKSKFQLEYYIGVKLEDVL